MAIAQSKLTSQGQISVPAEIRRRLGLRPGSVMEWDEKDGAIVVRRGGRYSWDDIHKAVFGKRKPKRRTVEEMDEGIMQYMREKHARR